MRLFFIEEENVMNARVHSVETFGLVDGPGVRFILFLHGCPFRCQFCHNPDTWASQKFEEWTPQQALDRALRFEPYWGKEGGITVSGGEPLVQIDFLLEFFKLAKAAGINTCIDTSGACFTREEPFFSKFEELMKYTDLLMVDIKEINDVRHQVLTGASNKRVLDMMQYLNDINKAIWIRHVLVPERSDFDEDLHALADYIDTLSNVKKVEVLPYHTLGTYKWKELNLEYQLEGIDPPTNERVENANKILHTDKYK